MPLCFTTGSPVFKEDDIKLRKATGLRMLISPCVIMIAQNLISKLIHSDSGGQLKN